LRCAAAVRRWLGYEGFRRLLGSYDILVLFVRGYAYREDWHAACFVFLERALLWSCLRFRVWEPRASPVRGGDGVRICCLQGLAMANTFIRTWALMTELQKKARAGWSGS
jgi:hypothetical protein